MRAVQPTESGQLHIDGFQIGYECFGDPARPAVLLPPTWQIVDSRIWKMQVPFLARHFRVITFDPPGNGLGERTTDPAAFEYERIARQGLGVLDHLGIARASVVAFSRGCTYGVWLAATQPERVERLVLIASVMTPHAWGKTPDGCFERRETCEGWQKENVHYWLEHYSDWLVFFFSQIFPEPHSTKGIDDGIGWGLGTNAEILAASVSRPELWPAMSAGEAVASVSCPILLLHGSADPRYPVEASRALAAARPDWEFVTLEGSGHVPICRDPVRVNLLIHAFLTASAAQAERQ